MEAAARADEAAVVWLNGLVGVSPLFDSLMRLLVSDYLAPVLIALMLLGMWFGAPLPAARVRQQKAVLSALIGMALGNLATLIVNQLVFRPRPFVDHPLTLLFYQPTDSSFPANPAVVGFALAAGIWGGNRRMGVAAYALASLWGFSRVFAGVTYPSDVLAGAAMGVAVTLAVCAALRWTEPLPTLVLRLARRFYLA
jgi:undecaprenyl-diphosphatase